MGNLPEKAKKATAILLAIVGEAGDIYGAHLQALASDNKRNYDWMQGHIRDLGFPMMWGALSHFVSKNKAVQRLFAYTPMAIGTLNEFHDASVGNSNYVDWTDITVYWLGAAAGRLGPNIASKVSESLQEAVFKNSYIRK